MLRAVCTVHLHLHFHCLSWICHVTWQQSHHMVNNYITEILLTHTHHYVLMRNTIFRHWQWHWLLAATEIYLSQFSRCLGLENVFFMRRVCALAQSTERRVLCACVWIKIKSNGESFWWFKRNLLTIFVFIFPRLSLSGGTRITAVTRRKVHFSPDHCLQGTHYTWFKCLDAGSRLDRSIFSFFFLFTIAYDYFISMVWIYVRCADTFLLVVCRLIQHSFHFASNSM